MKIFIYPENINKFFKKAKTNKSKFENSNQVTQKYDLLRNVTCLCVLCFYNFTLLF